MLGEGVTFKSDLNKIRTKLGKDLRQGEMSIKHGAEPVQWGFFGIFGSQREC